MTFERLKEILFWVVLVESEWHQHPNGNGWVQNTASVSDTCKIEGIVYGNAWVSGDAQVSGNAWVYSPMQIQGTRHFVTTCDHSNIRIGCHKHTPEYWKKHFKTIGKANGYTNEQIEEYGIIIDMCSKWMKLKFGKQVKRDSKGRFVK